VGSVAKGIGSLLGSGPGVRNVLERLGGQTALTNAYLAGVMSFFGLLGAAYAVSVVLRLRGEETDGLGDPVLAAATGRIRWAAGHLSVAVLGSAIALAGGGVSTGLFYALRAGDPGTQVTRLVGAALAQLPAVLAVAAVAMVLVGLLPRWAVPGSWTVVALAAVITLFGPAVKASQWLLDISPFSHVPKLPGGAVSAAPLIWLSAAALALAAVGLAGLRRRDIG
jgi:ABC-2 type transport system permease protein